MFVCVWIWKHYFFDFNQREIDFWRLASLFDHKMRKKWTLLYRNSLLKTF